MLIFIQIVQVYSQCSTKSFYSRCDSLNKRDLIIISSSECSNPEPQIFESLDCDFSCPAKTYLSISSSQQSCTQCPPGTFSIGGGFIYGKSGLPWSKAKSELINTCSIYENSIKYTNFACNNWRVEGDLLSSGSTSLNSSYTATLTFGLNTVKSGKFTVIYSKETLVSDKQKIGTLALIKNLKKVFEDDSTEEKNWKKISINLETGFNEVTIDFSSQSYKNDFPKAYIASVQVSGTEFAQQECFTCDVGNAFSGNEDCEICDFNEYWQDGVCEQCPAGTYSFKGSQNKESCIRMQPCTMINYRKVYSDCIDSVRIESFEWITPLLCDKSNLTLPSSQTVPCEKCKLGYFNKNEGSKSHCQACNSGQFLNQSSSTCQSCPAGKYSNKSLKITDWSDLPESFDTYCLTKTAFPCSHSSGWVPSSQYISTGLNHFEYSELFLSIPINIQANSGLLIVDLELIQKFNGSLVLLINNQKSKVWNLNERSLHLINLEKGFNLVQFVYWALESENDEVRIYSLEVVGSEKGAGLTCDQCEEGYYKGEYQINCSACEAGTSSNEENTGCLPCSYFEYSPRNGSPCFLCPLGTKSSENRKFCIGSKYIAVGSRDYYIEALTGTRNLGGNNSNELCNLPNSTFNCKQTFYGPINDDNADYFVSFLNPSLFELHSSDIIREQLPSYAYAIITKEVTGEDSKQLCLQNKEIISLGTKVENISSVPEGIEARYSEGDLCENSQRFTSSLTLICDQEVGLTFPYLASKSQCAFNFILKTRYACSKCQKNEYKILKGSCQNGLRKFQKIEGKGCILFPNQKTEWEESCSDYENLFNSWLFILLILFFTFIFLATIGVTYFLCKYKRGYKRLSETAIKEKE